MTRSQKALPSAALFFAATGLTALSLAAGAYLLSAQTPAEALGVGAHDGCEPALAPAGLGAYTVTASPAAPALDRVEARWTHANGSHSAWTVVAALQNGSSEARFTDADGSFTVSVGDVLTVAGGAGAAEFRCAR